MSAIALRRATGDDEAFLRALFRTTREPLLRSLQLGREQADAFCDMQFRAQATGYRARYPQAEYLVVCTGGAPIGRLTRALEEQHVVLVDIALMPAFRGQGIGASLIRQLQADCRALGTALALSVEASNPALGLYRRLGLEVVEEESVQLHLRWTPTTHERKRSEEWTHSSER